MLKVRKRFSYQIIPKVPSRKLPSTKITRRLHSRQQSIQLHTIRLVERRSQGVNLIRHRGIHIIRDMRASKDASCSNQHHTPIQGKGRRTFGSIGRFEIEHRVRGTTGRDERDVVETTDVGSYGHGFGVGWCEAQDAFCCYEDLLAAWYFDLGLLSVCSLIFLRRWEV